MQSGGLPPILMCVMCETDLIPRWWYESTSENGLYCHPIIAEIEPITGREIEVEPKGRWASSIKYSGDDLVEEHIVNQQKRDHWETTINLPSWWKYNKGRQQKAFSFNEWHRVLN